MTLTNNRLLSTIPPVIADVTQPPPYSRADSSPLTWVALVQDNMTAQDIAALLATVLGPALVFRDEEGASLHTRTGTSDLASSDHPE